MTARVRYLLVWIALGLFVPAGVRAEYVRNAVESVLAESPYANARVGVHAVALGTGRVLLARDAQEPFVPASNQKLVTAAAALIELGTQYRFETRLVGEGEMEGGVLRGDIVLEAGADPTLGGEAGEKSATDVMRRWAALMHRHGLRKITGDVVVDDSFLDAVFYHPKWPTKDACEEYQPTVGAATVDDNLVVIGIAPAGTAGSPAVVDLQPSWAPVELVNKCKTANRTHAPWFHKEPNSDRITVRGYVRRGARRYPGRVPVPNPSLYAARMLKAALAAEGIRVAGTARVTRSRTAAPERRLELYVRRTPLTVALDTMMKDSHNLTAEIVLKTLGAEADGDGSWARGSRQVGFMLQEMGFEPETHFVIADGSGLSRLNRLTPALLTTVLRHMHGRDDAAEFVSLLPVAGKSGTLKRRLTQAPYAGNVYAKTGYIRGVTGLSGYAETRSGIAVAFSILVNDPQPAASYSKRVLREKICRAIVDHAR